MNVFYAFEASHPEFLLDRCWSRWHGSVRGRGNESALASRPQGPFDPVNATAPWPPLHGGMPARGINSINRAPVLTLWGAIVAERLGFKLEEALTLGRAVAGLNAYSKGVSLGLFERAPEAIREQRRVKERKRLNIDLMHRAVPVATTAQGLRAIVNNKPITPESVERYLTSKFGDNLDAVVMAMRKLARNMPPCVLVNSAYRLYEQFRPGVPEGTRSWGAAGELDLRKFGRLGERTSVTAH